jgi:hypothetical protein
MESYNLVKLAVEELKGFIPKDIQICISKSDNFNVTLSENKLTVKYTRQNEFFRGLNICKRYMNKGDFSITESCRFDNLALLVDCSRNAVMNVDSVKKLIRMMALLGYNELQLYTEDTYEVEGEPYFGYLRGRYTVSELSDIVQYGKHFGIELVPCIQTLAHIESIFRWRDYGEIRDCNDILLIDEERTYTLIENMFKTLRKSFTSSKINICMDEAHMVGLGRYLKKHGFIDRFTLMKRHLEKVIAISKKYGFNKPVMWSDMFFRLLYGGEYYIEEGIDGKNVGNNVFVSIPEGIELLYWDYFSKDKSHYNNMIKHHQKFPNKIGFGGAGWNFTGFTPNLKFSMDATEKALQSCIDNGIKDVIMTTWGDNGAECPVIYTLPTLCLASELAYGNGLKEADESLNAVTNCNMKDFMMLEYPNQIDAVSAEQYTNPSKYLLYNDLFLGMFDSTVNEGTSALYNKYSRQLKQAEKRNSDLCSLFRRQRLLCEVLSLKSELGINTRTAYKKNDMAALNELADKKYTALLRKLNSFYHVFKTEWYLINKPFGFEVQDARLCGLMGRIKSCRERLKDYIDGKITKIEELEEKLLDYAGNENFTKQSFCFNNWAATISPGIV